MGGVIAKDLWLIPSPAILSHTLPPVYQSDQPAFHIFNFGLNSKYKMETLNIQLAAMFG